MRIAILLVVGLTALGACTEGSDTADQIARSTAKDVVNGIVANRFPGVNAAPLTDCIIDNASITEVYKIAEAAVVGPSPQTTGLIVDIARRPETVRCATDNALNTFVLGL